MPFAQHLHQIETYLLATTPVGTVRSLAPLPSAATQPLLLCTAEMLQNPDPVPDLSISPCDAASSLAALLENLDVNARGFDPSTPSPTVSEAEEFRKGMGADLAFTAHLGGQAVAAGMYLSPHVSTTELVGITTLEASRGRGVAAALTAAMAAHAFAAGVTVTFLITDNPAAQRVYERIGFRHAATIHEALA